MSLSFNTFWEVRTTGSDSNGGGFYSLASGTDYSQQDAAQKSGADLAIHAITNTKVQPVAAGVAAEDVGNIIQITGGTGFTTGFYEIKSLDGIYWALDRAAGTVGSTGGTYAMGGALGTVGMFGAAGGSLAYQTIFIKYSASAHLVTSDTVNVSGGLCGAQGVSQFRTVVGYDTTRTIANTDANRPTVRASGITPVSAVALFATNGLSSLRNVILDGNSIANVMGAYRYHLTKCRIVNFAAESTQVHRVIDCEFTGNSAVCTATFVGGSIAYANTATPWSATAFIDCLSYNNTGASTDGFGIDGGSRCAVSCTSYNNGRHGFYTGGSNDNIYAANCIAVNNGGYGFDGTASPSSKGLYDCAGYNNTSGNHNLTSPAEVIGFVSLTGDPFVAAASGNFALNNTAGAGAACRAAGSPRAFPLALTTSYADIGAVQHQDPGGLLIHPGMSGGVRG